ncbi:hypothetical protein WR25_10878 [Diploscapter pachys]|uniref:G-protein coupled receptors family 2 profile 2 domain-containing protein n=1 Tax=Diploscapter pachys TaxID=2018661 RepID=A0A2A2LZF5_9BILA|nr:hypothetical protein WR25_10878 [Diploscapter pachys]
MLLEGYQLYLMLIQVFEPSRTRILLYYMFCYGFPAVVVAISAASNWQNYGTDKYCWIDTTTPTIWAFIAPILIVIIANIIFLLIALKVVLSVQSRDRSKFDRIIGWLKGSATLLCLLGITWLFGFLTAAKGGTGTVFAWIFTILNCTQGIFIFVLHVVMNEKVRVALLRWLRKGVCCWSADSSVGDNSRSLLSSRQRILNMVKTTKGGGGEHSSPSTASTDDKEKQMTPTSKTNEWLRQISITNKSLTGSQKGSFDVQPSPPIVEDHHSTSSSDPRGSLVLETIEPTPVLRQIPLRRTKFPLGASEDERGSTHRVVVERF